MSSEHSGKEEAKKTLGSQAAEEFLRIFQRGLEFLREVVSENERLRYQVAALEEQLRTAREQPYSKHLEEEVITWKHKYEELLKHLEEIRTKNESIMQRFISVEEENNSLANLYIASYQLHTTLNFQEVLQIILEIVINLVGAEAFAIYLLNPRERILEPQAGEGMNRDQLPRIPIEGTLVGKAVLSGELYLNEDLLLRGGTPENPIVVVPLLIKGEPIGAVVLFKMLPQKTKLQEVDRELFNLLAGHAATALFAAKLYSESERKRTTMQGFIELLTR
jgi:nitrate/nitrite-specific signal transduction histidine kinase